MSTLAINIPVPASGDGIITNVSSLVGPKTVLLSGLFRGAYTLLASQDDANFVPILQFNAGGVEGVEQTVPGSMKSMRLRANASPTTAITCSVSGLSGTDAGVNDFATVATLAAGFRGTTTSIDTYTLFPPSGLEDSICFLCRGLFQGQVAVEGSNDNANWNPIGAFQAPFIPQDLLGLPNVLEFEPLGTNDKVRYLRLNVLGATTGAVVVTVGGNVLAGAGGSALPDLSNLTPTAINRSLVPGVAGTIDLGSTSKPWRNLYLAGGSGTPGTNNFEMTGTATAPRTISLPDVSGTVITTQNFNDIPDATPVESGLMSAAQNNQLADLDAPATGTIPAFVAGAATITPGTDLAIRYVLAAAATLSQVSTLTLSTAGAPVVGNKLVMCYGLALGYVLNIHNGGPLGGTIATIEASLAKPKGVVVWWDGTNYSFNGYVWGTVL